MLWAQGNRGADILADMGAQSLLWKDHIVKQLARVVQTMQVTIRASFKGHVCSDVELTAAEVSTLVQDTWDAYAAQWNDIDFDDPSMSDFLCQEDCEVNLNPDEPDLYEEFGAGRDGEPQMQVAQPASGAANDTCINISSSGSQIKR